MSGHHLTLAAVAALAAAGAVRRRGRGSRAINPALVRAVQDQLTPDLIRQEHCVPTGVSPLECHCYHAAEAVYHLAGGKRAGLVAARGPLRGGTHWWLETDQGRVIDPTASQLPSGYPYHQGTRAGFLTREPSERARVVMDRVKRRGSRSVVTPAGYHRTALSRRGPSRPLRHFSDQGLVRGRVLDFGSGRGADCAAAAVRCYDPHHPRSQVRALPQGQFDTVLAIYVLNVLPASERRRALRGAAARVRPGGHLLLAARSQQDSGYQAARDWSRQGDGYAQHTPEGALHRFQRFYASDDALARDAGAALSASFARVPVAALGGDTAVAAYRRAS
jgi:hypothetical protein